MGERFDFTLAEGQHCVMVGGPDCWNVYINGMCSFPSVKAEWIGGDSWTLFLSSEAGSRELAIPPTAANHSSIGWCQSFVTRARDEAKRARERRRRKNEELYRERERFWEGERERMKR